LRFTILAYVATLLSAQAAHAAGGAFAVDDAEVGAPGSCKVESWGSLADNHDLLGVVSPACVFNVGRPVELGLSVARFRSEGAWGTELVLKGKTSIIPVEPGKIGAGISFAPAIDLLTGEFAGSLLNVPLTYQVNEQFKINLNGGWLYNHVDDFHRAYYGAGFEWNFVKPVTLIAEVFGFAGHKVDPASETEPRVQAGLRFMPVENVDIDLIYGRNILGEDANWFTLGLNVRFEPPQASK
jgi:hypothetical protein